jgi:hypothetical protein
MRAEMTDVNWEGWSEGLEKLGESCNFLHDLLYLGDKHPLKLRNDLPIDVQMDLVGLLHDLNWAEKRISLRAPDCAPQAS